MPQRIVRLSPPARATLLAIAFVAFAPAGASLADEDGLGPASVAPAVPAPPAADAPQIEHFEYWQARGDVARQKVATARARLDEANGAVSRMQRRNHPRGEARVALRDEQASARAAYEAALHHLEVELPAEARAAGAQTRWLRDPNEGDAPRIRPPAASPPA